MVITLLLGSVAWFRHAPLAHGEAKGQDTPVIQEFSSGRFYDQTQASEGFNDYVPWSDPGTWGEDQRGEETARPGHQSAYRGYGDGDDAWDGSFASDGDGDQVDTSTSERGRDTAGIDHTSRDQSFDGAGMEGDSEGDISWEYWNGSHHAEESTTTPATTTHVSTVPPTGPLPAVHTYSNKYASDNPLGIQVHLRPN